MEKVEIVMRKVDQDTASETILMSFNGENKSSRVMSTEQ